MNKKTKKVKANLGIALVKDRFGSSHKRRNNDSMLHTTELDDGYNWNRLNLQSVTEENSFQEFLSKAELAGTEFHAEKLNITFIDNTDGLLSNEEKQKVLKSHEENRSLLKIPRRPKWKKDMTVKELQMIENNEFLIWRHQLSRLEESQGLLLTPYEKNLEFWRQLWRVVERSDVVVQITDARNPLLFRCEDLEHYVKEVDSRKVNMILINKAEFLTRQQRIAWVEYFNRHNIRIAFFSAKNSEIKVIEEETSDKISNDEASETSSESSETNSESSETSSDSDTDYESAEENLSECCGKPIEKEIPLQQNESKQLNMDEVKSSIEEISKQSQVEESPKIVNSPEILTRTELIQLFRTLCIDETTAKQTTTIGLVGYPNVGKSSTINALLMNKKVSVSATPGKTKHYQTHYLEDDLLLCDCPGLVMPSFICTKSEMILNGILPIDQMRDHVAPVTLLGTLIPKHVIEDQYGVMMPVPSDGEDPNRPPTAEEILSSYAYNRGFMTQAGRPDNSRAARYILKDFVNGKLLYCVAPPSVPQDTYHIFPPRRKSIPVNSHIPAKVLKANKVNEITMKDIDRQYFGRNIPGVHVNSDIWRKRNTNLLRPDLSSKENGDAELLHANKPWKKINKYRNKNKREKSRRVYAHLDKYD